MEGLVLFLMDQRYISGYTSFSHWCGYKMVISGYKVVISGYYWLQAYAV